MLSGLLFFPVTPFTVSGTVDLDVLAEHIRRGVAAGPGAVFVACGTGEVHSLSNDEFTDITRKAVETVAGALPVLVGVGGTLPAAIRCAGAAASAGADGLLLLPPYLVTAPDAGLVDYVRKIAAATELPLIVYQRGTAIFSPQAVAEIATIDNVVGFKDGYGDLELMQRIVLAVRSRVGDKPFQFFNGLPTAELTQRAYKAIGVELYSSSTFAFAPEIATEFFRALVTRDEPRVVELLEHFYAPFVELRNRQQGYAVSLVKAGVRLRGLDVGQVRTPLVEPSAPDIAALQQVLQRGLEIVNR